MVADFGCELLQTYIWLINIQKTSKNLSKQCAKVFLEYDFFILGPPAMCHPDQRAVTELGNNE